jgi:hypothetical protein
VIQRVSTQALTHTDKERETIPRHADTSKQLKDTIAPLMDVHHLFPYPFSPAAPRKVRRDPHSIARTRSIDSNTLVNLVRRMQRTIQRSHDESRCACSIAGLVAFVLETTQDTMREDDLFHTTGDSRKVEK